MELTMGEEDLINEFIDRNLYTKTIDNQSEYTETSEFKCFNYIKQIKTDKLTLECFDKEEIYKQQQISFEDELLYKVGLKNILKTAIEEYHKELMEWKTRMNG